MRASTRSAVAAARGDSCSDTRVVGLRAELGRRSRVLALGALLLGAPALGEEVPTDAPRMFPVRGGMVSVGDSPETARVVEVPPGWYLNDRGYEVLNGKVTAMQEQNAACQARVGELSTTSSVNGKLLLIALGIGAAVGAGVTALALGAR